MKNMENHSEMAGARFPLKKTTSKMCCCVWGCKSKACNNPDVRFHYFPKPNMYFIKTKNIFGEFDKVDCRKEWQKVLRIGKKITQYMQVCSLHFKESDYIVTGKKYLKKGAVPSCNLPSSNTKEQLCNLQETDKSIRRLKTELNHIQCDNDVLSARHRLAGALKELVQQDGGDAVSSDDDSRNRNSRSDLLVRKTKRRRTENDQAAFHHTYVMKLFDRSVDLAQFEENTPLYPICRAWMANQPRNPMLVIKRRISSPEPNTNGSDNINAEVRELPPPVIEKVNRVPSPLPEQVEKDTNTEFLNQNSLNALSREQLLQTHRKRWNNVRRRWHEQARKYEERYQTSTDILTSIYNRAQENMA